MPPRKTDDASPEPEPETPSPAAEGALPAVTPAPAPPAPAGRKPLPGESSDPHVHWLLAVRQTHAVTLRAGANPPNREAAERAMADIDRELAELGYETEA